ncbi:hypothetical protein EBU71_07415 [bacterium]|jgi:endonuclease III|nr:hypothetical protein [Candidatus Elulimicrobium humile]
MIDPMLDHLMVQQQLPGGLDSHEGIWQHMVAVIMLNQTNRKGVKYILPLFLQRWPNPIHFLMHSDEDTVKDIIWPLGLVNVREKRIRSMTEQYLNWDGKDATDLYGIGKYGSDSYEIFVKKNYSIEPTDKELKRYLEEEVFNVFETA